MYQFMTKYGQLLAFGTGILVTAIFMIGIFTGLGDFQMLSESEQGTSNIFNFGLYAAIGLTIICALAWLVFSIINIADDPKGSIRGLIGVGALAVVFFILYTMAKPATGSVAATMADFDVSAKTGKFISAAMITTGVLLAGAVLAAAISEIRNFFK